MRGRERAESEAVDEARLRRRRQRVQHRAQTGEVRLVQAVAIDVAGGNRAHDDLLRATEHGVGNDGFFHDLLLVEK